MENNSKQHNRNLICSAITGLSHFQAEAYSWTLNRLAPSVASHGFVRLALAYLKGREVSAAGKEDATRGNGGRKESLAARGTYSLNDVKKWGLGRWGLMWGGGAGAQFVRTPILTYSKRLTLSIFTVEHTIRTLSMKWLRALRKEIVYFPWRLRHYFWSEKCWKFL